MSHVTLCLAIGNALEGIFITHNSPGTAIKNFSNQQKNEACKIICRNEILLLLDKKFTPPLLIERRAYIAHYQKRKLVMYYLDDGGCSHIGEDFSVSHLPKKNFLYKLFKL